MSASNLLDRIDFAALPAARREAATRFRARGWPDRHDEAWHYTDLNARLKSYDLTLPGAAGDIAALVPKTSLPTIMVVNGRLVGKLPNCVTAHHDNHSMNRTAELPLVDLNTAIADHGAIIDIPATIDAGTMVLIAVAAAAGQVVIAPRHRISVGPGGALTLIEIACGQGDYLHDPVVEITLAAGATLRHYRLQDEAAEAVHVTTVFAELAEDANYSSFLLNCGAKLSRNEIHATLSGPHADVHLNAAQLLAGRQHGDITTVIAHDAPNCASRQTVKSVLAGAARGVFQGRIEVARAAQKTDGYQMNQALLLSPDAEIDIKPELEIFADDVKCSHGATIGALDPEQLFYLRSRGIPEAEARALLIRAFIDDALEPVIDATARDIFETAIEAWWHKGVA